jgi:hypothetical protein
MLLSVNPNHSCDPTAHLLGVPSFSVFTVNSDTTLKVLKLSSGKEPVHCAWRERSVYVVLFLT